MPGSCVGNNPDNRNDIPFLYIDWQSCSGEFDNATDLQCG